MSTLSDPIDTLILDLGGVIIDIDPNLTTKAFQRIGAGEALKDHSKAEQHRLFDLLERGEIEPEEFRNKLREIANIRSDDQTIDQAWNRMLIGIPEERYKMLELLKEHYTLVLLSNTNAIHLGGFCEIVDREYGTKKFFSLFDGVFLSHEIGARKPEEKVFQKVLDRIGKDPSSTLFIDDTEPHVVSARKVGIHGYYLDLSKETLTDLRKKLLDRTG